MARAVADPSRDTGEDDWCFLVDYLFVLGPPGASSADQALKLGNVGFSPCASAGIPLQSENSIVTHTLRKQVRGMDGSSAKVESGRLYEGIAAETRWAEAELYRRFEGRVRVLAARRGVRAAQVEDVVQETMMGVVEALREGRLLKGSRLTSFVYGTARNVISNRRRRQSLTAFPQTVENPDIYRSNTPDPLVNLVRSEERKRVLACLERLSNDDREILEMAFYQGLPPREIAAELDIAANVARQRKWRALKRFATIWDELYPS